MVEFFRDGNIIERPRSALPVEILFNLLNVISAQIIISLVKRSDGNFFLRAETPAIN